MSHEPTLPRPPLPCPICRRPVARPPAEARFRPFCTKRCADLDLHRWLSGSYRIASAEEPDPGAEAGEQPERGRGE